MMRALEAALSPPRRARFKHRAAARGCTGAAGRERSGRRTRSGKCGRPLPGNGARGRGLPFAPARPSEPKRVSAETRADNAPASEPAASASAHGLDEAVIEAGRGAARRRGWRGARLRCRAGGAVSWPRWRCSRKAHGPGVRRALEGRDRNQVSSPVVARNCDAHSNIGPKRRGSPIWSVLLPPPRGARNGFRPIQRRPDGEPQRPPGWRGMRAAGTRGWKPPASPLTRQNARVVWGDAERSCGTRRALGAAGRVRSALPTPD